MPLKELKDSGGTVWLIDKKYVSAVCQSPNAPSQQAVHIVGINGPIMVTGTLAEVTKSLGLAVPKKAAPKKAVPKKVEAIE